MTLTPANRTLGLRLPIVIVIAISIFAAPILADLIGIALKTAVKWAALAARDWRQYTADRAADEGILVVFGLPAYQRLCRPSM